MSFAFTFSDEEEDEQVQQEYIPTPSSSKLHAKQEDLIIDSGEFNPIYNDQFERTEKIADVTAYTDVIHGLYEGGFKLWECSNDLLSYLNKQDKEQFIGQRVVDLGCGHGHPGIWCLTRGAAVSCLQDLNIDVFSLNTLPNLLNLCGAAPIIKKKDTICEPTISTAGKDSKEAGQDTAQTEDAHTEAETESTDTKKPDLDEISRLKLLIQSNINTGASSSIQSDSKKSRDLLQYETIKAMVLAGEESDPEMLEWLIEIEEEMALEAAKQASTQGDENDQKEAKTVNRKGTKIIQNQGYSLPNQDTILQPHATFVYGPWGKHSTESAMLLSNVHGVQPCTDFVPTISTKSIKTKTPQFVLNYPVFEYKTPVENKEEKEVTVATTDKDSVLSCILFSFVSHFTNTSTQNSPLCCTLVTESISSDDKNDKEPKYQYSLTISKDSTTFSPQDLVSVLSLSSPSTSPDVNSKTTLGVSITPVSVTFDVLEASSSTLPPSLLLLTILTEVINAMYTKYLSEITAQVETKGELAPLLTSDLTKFPLPFALPKRRSKYQKPRDAYAHPSYCAPDYSLTTVLVAKASSRYYREMVSSGLVEVSWDKPLDCDEIKDKAEVVITTIEGDFDSLKEEKEKKDEPNDDQNEQNEQNGQNADQIVKTDNLTSLSVPQFNSVTTTFARPFCQDVSSQNQGQCQAQSEEYKTQIDVFCKLLLTSTTPSSTLPTALPFTSTQLPAFYGAHAIDSPFRFKTILSSDTIYSCPTMPIFIQSLRSLLHRDGKALVAAKRYYFGVGGSTAEFCQLIEDNCPDMRVEQVDKFIDGASNIREILQVTWDQEKIKGLW